MMQHGKTIIRSYMTFDFSFSGIRIQDGYLTPVDWDLSVDLVVKAPKNKNKNDIEYKASILYQRIYFWLDSNLQNIAMVDVSNDGDLYLANLSSNITMYCPGNPSDDLIIQLLHSKMCSLITQELQIGEIRLRGSDTSLQYTFDSPERDYQLPLTTNEYYTEGTCRDLEPWWTRNDGFCFEFVRPDDTEITNEELFKDIIDPMVEFERVIEEVSETGIGMVREPARIVQVEKWKPRKVE